jgi:hypothetical protein
MTTPFLPNYTPATLATHKLLNQLIDGITEQANIIQHLAQEVAQLREELGDALAAQPAPAPAAVAQPVVAQGIKPTGNYEQFPATSIEYGIMDGKPVYKIRGGRWEKFGVRIWPEAMQAMGIVADQLKPGNNPLTGNVVALIGDKGPQKVVAWASK